MHRNRYQIMIYIAMLAAQAVVISMIEMLIPSPFSFAPGAKLGFANLIIIIALFTLPLKYSIQVLIIRLLVTALLGGTLSTFLYSATGGILSFIAMLLAKQLGPKRVSIIGISVLGGVMHNVGQLLMASLMAQSWTVMNYLPVLSLTGILSGFLVGVLGNLLLQRIKRLRLYHQDMAKSGRSQNWLDDKESPI